VGFIAVEKLVFFYTILFGSLATDFKEGCIDHGMIQNMFRES